MGTALDNAARAADAAHLGRQLSFCASNPDDEEERRWA